MKDSLLFYVSQYQAIACLANEQLGRLFRTIFERQLGNDVNIDDDIKIAFNFINNQLNIDAEKWKDEKNKRSEAGKRHVGNQYTRAKEKEQNGTNGTQFQNNGTNGTNGTDNVNDNVNVNDNENVSAIADINGDSCVDDHKQFDSCADGIVKFYEHNRGTLSPYEYELLNGYRSEFPDDVIIYALSLQVEAKARSINYTKAILNNWLKKNIKNLADAKNENARKIPTKEKVIDNKYHSDNDSQYIDLDRFYVN